MNIKCKYCGSEDVSFGENTGMYYCRVCNRLLGADEVLTENEDGDDVPIADTESEDNGDFGTAALIVLNAFMLIPVLNAVVMTLVNSSDAKYEYKKCFFNRFVVDLFVMAAVILLVIVEAFGFKNEHKDTIHDNVKSVVEDAMDFSNPEVSVSEFVTKNMFDILQSRYVPTTDDEEEEQQFKLTWDMLDGTVMSGEHISDLLSKSGEDMILLIQTPYIVERYSETTYRNMGYMVAGAEILGTTGNYFYVGSLDRSLSVFIDDYNEPTFMSTDDLYNKKYVYYLNPKLSYRFDVLTSEDGDMVGLAFTEVTQ